MSRVSMFSSPFLLGFDDLERGLDRVSKAAADGYPPYNIEREPPEADGSERIRITLAVAGFARDNLDITIEDKQLNIRGKQKDDEEREFLHRGIAARQFSRSFVLADGMDVIGARLGNGLLEVNLRKSAPERVVRRIEISE